MRTVYTASDDDMHRVIAVGEYTSSTDFNKYDEILNTS